MSKIRVKALSVLLAFIMIVTSMPAVAYAGSQTTNSENTTLSSTEDEVKISNEEELSKISDGNYVLTQNIEIKGEWTPLEGFSGTLNGNGFSIILNGNSLFSSTTKDALIHNLILKGTVTYSGKVSDGPLVTTNNGTIRNCVSNVAMDRTAGYGNIGGFVGTHSAGVISNCVTLGTYTRTLYGVAGTNAAQEGISNCYFSESSGAENATWPTAYANDCSKKTARELKETSFLTGMNNRISSGDLSWGLDGDENPVPGGTGAGIDIDKTRLDSRIKELEVITNPNGGTTYSAASWKTFQKALEEAKKINENDTASQSQVDTALSNLNTEYSNLKEDISGKVNRSELQQSISKAQEKTAIYKASTWENFKKALSSANSIYADVTQSQENIDEATTNLNKALENLEERNLKAEAPSGSVVDISSEADFKSAMSVSASEQEGKTYRLTKNITLSEDYSDATTLNLYTLLEGNGFTITLSESTKQIFNTIGETGKVQNLGITGTSAEKNLQEGALAQTCKGIIVNCYNRATFNYDAGYTRVGGMVGTLKSGGAIVNSYFAGELNYVSERELSVGGLAGLAEDNAGIRTSYWLSGISNVVGEGTCNIDKVSTAKSSKQFYDKTSVIALLNENKSDNAMSWNQSKDGYPWFGEDFDFVPPTENQIQMKYLDLEKLADGEYDFVNRDNVDVNDTLTLSPLLAGANGLVGDLDYLPDTTAGFQVISGTSVSVTNTGWVYVKGGGTTVVGAYNPNVRDPLQFTYSEEWGRIYITVTSENVVDIKFSAANAKYDEKSDLYTVEGRTALELSVNAKFQGSDEYFDVSDYFDYTGDTSIFYINDGFATPKMPYDEKSITATPKKGIFSGVDTMTIKTRSTYVPLESVSINQLDNARTVLHQRQSSTTENPGAFAYPVAGSLRPDFYPENASYQDGNWTIESSDNSIAAYGSDVGYNLCPYKAGTISVTATATDKGADGAGTTKIKSKEYVLNFTYENPLKSLTMSEDSVSVSVGERIALPMVMTGENSGIVPSMCDMKWSVEGSGNVVFDHDPVSIGNQANPQWYVTGAKAGVVRVTGTPVDDTNKVESVSFTVFVGSSGEEVSVDYNQLVKDSISKAQAYMKSNKETYKYHDEWNVMGLLRSGETLSESQKEKYLDSVENWLEENINSDFNTTDMDRVAIGLGALGEDLTNFRGYDIVSAIANAPELVKNTGTSNDWAYALIALDTNNYKIPENSIITRDKIIDVLINDYQGANGGFGLSGKTGESVDMTAMIVQALAPYADQPEVKTSINKALDYLREEQKSTGGYSSAESDIQVLVALVSLGLDPLDEETGFAQVLGNLITDIISYQDEETGAFKHSGEIDGMATEQALYGLAAYERYITGGTRLYDYSDFEIKAALEKRIGVAENFDEKDYEASSWKVFYEALSAAKELMEQENPSEEAMREANRDLSDAIAKLEKKSASDILNDAKTSAKSALSSYKDMNEYRTLQQKEIANIIAAATAVIENAVDTEAVNSALSNAKAEMDKIKTNAQLTAEEKAAAEEAEKEAKARFSGCKFSLSYTSTSYSGKAKKPSVTVKYGSTKLKNGTDYTIKYKNNKAIGKATVTVTGKGKYSGSKTLSFKINPKKQSIKLSKGTKSFTVKWTKTKQASGYQIMYAKNSKFTKGKHTITVKSYKTSKKKVKKLSKKKKYYVKVRTYKTVNGVKYYGPWSSVKSVKTK